MTITAAMMSELAIVFAKYLDHVGQCTGRLFLPGEVITKKGEQQLPSNVAFGPEELVLINKLADMQWRKPLDPQGRAVTPGWPEEYNFEKDFDGSVLVAYEAIKERIAQGGPPWEPKDPTDGSEETRRPDRDHQGVGGGGGIIPEQEGIDPPSHQ